MRGRERARCAWRTARTKCIVKRSPNTSCKNMKLAGKVAVVTGGASGIGRALCRRFAAEGARGVVVADIDATGAGVVAAAIGGIAAPADVSREADIQRLVERASAAYGAIDLF